MTPLTAFLLSLTLGGFMTTVFRRCRHSALLDLRAHQDFEWRTVYYRRCGHWRWQKDWTAIEVTSPSTQSFPLSEC